ncbi:TELO2-interacting protein 2 isoform X2 [Hippocampus comes]|uniref:TELO2-interacting protein 2 isoform X2 n=1 Tax=Hippocampus comes TaxID=109280 RepID=UPI00094E05EA|nr:PREDICTED: TELO2-interacting protein 2 isoform X2 [Hippocampus comes]
MTDFSALLDELALNDDERPFPTGSLPPITALLPELRRRLMGQPLDPSLPVQRVGWIFRAADPQWLLGPVDEPTRLEAAYVSVVSALIGRASLPPCDTTNAGPPALRHYADVPAVAAALQALLAKLQAVGPDSRARAVTLAVAPHVCVFAAMHMQERSWTSRASREASRGLESQLLAAGGWRDSAHMLTGGGPDAEAGILGAVLDVLQPALSREARQQCDEIDEVDSVFAWTLFQVQRPFLASLLPRLLGPALLLSDHHDANKCMLGIRCLHHIVSNTAASELRALNRADVMYDALFKHLHGSNADIMRLVLSCLLDLLAVLESAPSAAVPPAGSVANRRTACRHDDVLRLLLTRMEAEHKVALRRVYAQALPTYLQRMGVCACRHFGRLSRVLPAYLEVSDAPEELTRLDTLEALQQLFTAAWPRLAGSVDVWLPCLLRLLVDASSEPSLRHDVGRQLSRRAARCLALLDAAAHGHLQVPICPRVTC